LAWSFSITGKYEYSSLIRSGNFFKFIGIGRGKEMKWSAEADFYISDWARRRKTTVELALKMWDGLK